MKLFRIVFCFALTVSALNTSLGQSSEDQEQLLRVRQRVEDLAVNFPPQIKKLDEPTVRVFLKLRIASVLWLESEPSTNSVAQSLTLSALEELEAERNAVPQLYLDIFRRDLLALLEAYAPDVAKHHSGKGIDVAYSVLNSKGKEGVAIAMLDQELANGWVPDSRLIFFLHRLRTDQPAELPNALSVILSAEERRAGTIPVEELVWLVNFYLNPDSQPELKRRFLVAAVNATSQSYTISDPQVVSHSYNLLVLVLPHVKSSIPSLYAQAVGQLSSLMTRVPKSRSEREAIEERIRTSSDSLSQTISEARSANEPNLKDELFLQAARLALEKGKLKLSFELATSMSKEGNRKKWREQFLTQLANSAIEKKNADIAGQAIAKIESASTRIPVMQKLSLYFFESKDVWKARQVFIDNLKAINSLEDKTEKSLALLRVLPVALKINDEILPEIADQTVKSINRIPSADRKGDRTLLNEYVKKTLMPLTWQALPAFQSLAERDEMSTLDFVNRIQQHEIRTSALLGIAIGRLAAARREVPQPNRSKTRARNIQPN
jgi:hypothetical protein